MQTTCYAWLMLKWCWISVKEKCKKVQRKQNMGINHNAACDLNETWRQIDHGFGTGHIAVAPRRPGVTLPLLPLKQLPHGVVAHGAALVHRRGAQGLVVQRRRHAADAVPLCHAVPGHAAVAVAIMRHVWHPIARHVPRQRLIRRDAGKKKRKTLAMFSESETI